MLMNRYLVALVVLVVAGICCLALFSNSQKDDAPVPAADKILPSFAGNTHGGSAIVAEEQREAEGVAETEAEASSDVEAEEVVAEPEIVVPMEEEAEPEDVLSLDSFDRPYNHTVTEEDFGKMSPEDQRKVIDEVVADARELKMGVMACYQETQELIRAGNYPAAEEKVSGILDASIAYDGGEGTLTLSRIMSLNSQNDLLGIMNHIYGAANNTDAKARVGERMQDIQGSMKTLKERQDKSYTMYWNK